MNEEKSTCSSSWQTVEGQKENTLGRRKESAIKEDGRGKNRTVAWLKEIQPGMKINLLTVQCAESPIFHRRGDRLVTVNRWSCTCECGKSIIVRHNCLRFNRPISCGCFRDAKLKKSVTTHGLSKTRAYKIWLGMRDRCQNPLNTSFSNYGGRGIAVCARWDEFISFLADMGNPPTATSIDRIDNNGNYEPSNCRWATAREQANNTRFNRLITLNGVTKNITQWAGIIGHTVKTIDRRIARGLPIDRALSPSIRPKLQPATP